MENKKSNYSYNEPIIEFSIASVLTIAFIVLVIATGFYWGYLFILIVPLYFVIDGIFTTKRIKNYKKQEENRKIDSETSN